MSLSHKPPYLQSPLYNVSLYKLTSVSIQAYGANFATYNKYKLTTVSIQASVPILLHITNTILPLRL